MFSGMSASRYWLTIAFTRPCLSSVTIPSRRYQTPSFVRQTSSASILPPLVRRITGLPPSFLPKPGPLVETGMVDVFACAVTTRCAAGFGGSTGAGEAEAISTGVGAIMGVVCGGRTIGPAGTPIVDIVCAARRARWVRAK